MGKKQFKKQIQAAQGSTSVDRTAHGKQMEQLRARATALHQKGQLGDAIALYHRILTLTPTDSEIWNNLGVAYEAQTQFNDAIAAYQQAITLQPNYPQALANLGNALAARHRIPEAIRCYQQAIAVQPNYTKAHTNLGTLYREQGQVESAVVHFRHAVLAQPNPATYLNLANALQEYGSVRAAQGFDEAIALYRSVLSVQPEAEVYYNLGTALFAQQRNAEAMAAFQEAIALQPNFVNAYSNLGLCLYDLGLFDQAIAAFQTALSIDPNHVESHANLGSTLLLLGDWPTGFEHYEYRLKWRGLETLSIHCPIWDGSELTGKTILLQTELGYGDTIHCIRYVPWLYQQGAAQVWIQSSAPLRRLLQTLPNLHIWDETTIPDYRLSIMSLPHRCKTTVETVPNSVPYVKACPSSALNLGQSQQLRVGIVWASAPRPVVDQYRSYRGRSCPLEQFLQAVTVPGVQLFSLQVGQPAAELECHQGKPSVVDLSDRITDFADTADLIEQLDLIITVDTAVAHLAGALGKPVWVLLPFAPDWRWLLHRSDSPWYPTMRLFRQDAPHHWDSVIQAVYQALTTLF